ncbi:hypothetical protein [Streptomyces sp. ACT015]|uniref:hypothetical protein n=1 Tax=Streptomyces sp. ACT015 TaxID=3134807 RepID=UPI003D167224
MNDNTALNDAVRPNRNTRVEHALRPDDVTGRSKGTAAARVILGARAARAARPAPVPAGTDADAVRSALGTGLGLKGIAAARVIQATRAARAKAHTVPGVPGRLRSLPGTKPSGLKALDAAPDARTSGGNSASARTSGDNSARAKTPGDKSPGARTFGDKSPGDTTPSDKSPGDRSLGGSTPSETAPSATTPGGTAPSQTAPGDTTPRPATDDPRD